MVGGFFSRVAPRCVYRLYSRNLLLAWRSLLKLRVSIWGNGTECDLASIHTAWPGRRAVKNRESFHGHSSRKDVTTEETCFCTGGKELKRGGDSYTIIFRTCCVSRSTRARFPTYLGTYLWRPF